MQWSAMWGEAEETQGDRCGRMPETHGGHTQDEQVWGGEGAMTE